MSGADALKEAAARRAVDEVESGMVLGLGTGSTVAHFLSGLGERLRDGDLRDVVGVPTSVRTADAAQAHGIPVGGFAEHPTLDLAVDGADEVDPELDLIKGLGGALLREKIVATASRRLVIIVDEGKLVEGLGRRSPLPVEVAAFGWQLHLPFLESLGARPTLREETDGAAYTTDNGNYVIDCDFPDGIDDPGALEESLRVRVGVVETGLFLGLTDRVIVGASEGTRILERNGVE